MIENLASLPSFLTINPDKSITLPSNDQANINATFTVNYSCQIVGLETKVSKINFSATGKLLSPPWEPPVCTTNCGNATNSTNDTVPTNITDVAVLVDPITNTKIYFNPNYYFPTGRGPFFRNKFYDT